MKNLTRNATATTAGATRRSSFAFTLLVVASLATVSRPAFGFDCEGDCCRLWLSDDISLTVRGDEIAESKEGGYRLSGEIVIETGATDFHLGGADLVYDDVTSSSTSSRLRAKCSSITEGLHVRGTADASIHSAAHFGVLPFFVGRTHQRFVGRLHSAQNLDRGMEERSHRSRVTRPSPGRLSLPGAPAR